LEYAFAAVSAVKLVGDLIGILQKTKDAKAKQMAETLKSHVEILASYTSALEKERERLKQELADQEKELKQLRESLAAQELSTDYDTRNGLLYNQKTGEGPFCPNDRMRMTLIFDEIWRCPKCKCTTTK
jgi:hypothetical protein